MVLRRGKQEKYESRRRYSGDQRRFKAWAVYSYFDGNGDEYRRAFWADVGTSRTEFDLIAPMFLTEGRD